MDSAVEAVSRQTSIRSGSQAAATALSAPPSSSLIQTESILATQKGVSGSRCSACLMPPPVSSGSARSSEMMMRGAAPVASRALRWASSRSAKA